jgi:hypothetical protein
MGVLLQGFYKTPQTMPFLPLQTARARNSFGGTSWPPRRIRFASPDTLDADAGYDAEWIHAQCREEWGPESVIKPAVQRADGKRNGIWRLTPFFSRVNYTDSHLVN